MPVLRHFDLVVLVIALPVFIAAGLPILGYATGAGAWLMWKGIGIYATRRAAATKDPRSVAGWMAGSMVGRGWLLGLTIIGVGLADRDAGLAGAVLVFVLFTIHLTIQMILRPFDIAPEPRR